VKEFPLNESSVEKGSQVLSAILSLSGTDSALSRSLISLTDGEEGDARMGKKPMRSVAVRIPQTRINAEDMTRSPTGYLTIEPLSPPIYEDDMSEGSVLGPGDEVAGGRLSGSDGTKLRNGRGEYIRGPVVEASRPAGGGSGGARSSKGPTARGKITKPSVQHAELTNVNLSLEWTKDMPQWKLVGDGVGGDRARVHAGVPAGESNGLPLDEKVARRFFKAVTGGDVVAVEAALQKYPSLIRHRGAFGRYST